MNCFQIRKFIVRDVDRNGEKKTRISPINQFVRIVFNEIGVFFVPCCDQTVAFGLDADLFRLGIRCRPALRLRGRRNIPLGETCLSLTIL